jgi:hypothetical protein
MFLRDSTYSFNTFYLQAFDQHLNMILGDVEEVVTTHEIDEETDEEIVKVNTSLLYVLGYTNALLECLCVTLGSGIIGVYMRRS